VLEYKLFNTEHYAHIEYVKSGPFVCIPVLSPGPRRNPPINLPRQPHSAHSRLNPKSSSTATTTIVAPPQYYDTTNTTSLHFAFCRVPRASNRQRDPSISASLMRSCAILSPSAGHHHFTSGPVRALPPIDVVVSLATMSSTP
jgi:hypothetical protein